jgi:predicted amidohydrolase YtcJ
VPFSSFPISSSSKIVMFPASKLKFSLSVVVFITCIFDPSVRAQDADQVFFNGKILTVDPDFSVVEAVAVKDGRISAVGSVAELHSQVGPDTKRIDLKGRTVIPGLIDNHLHYMRGASRWRFEARIDGITSREEALKVIAAKAKAAGPGKWVFVLGGWSEQQFADRPGGFTEEELDAAAPENPVFIQKSYSRAYMNSLAAKELSSSSNAGRSQGRSSGSSGRRSSGARAVINQATSFLPERSDAERVEDVAYFNSALNRHGLTTVYDVGRGSDGDFTPVEELMKRNELTARVFHSLRYQAYNSQEADEAVALIKASTPLDNNDWFGLLGMGEHIYNPAHDSTMRSSIFGREIWNEFEKLARVAAEGGWHIHEHAMQESTASTILDIAERIDREHSMRELRWTLAHCDLISRESIERAKDLGLTLAVHNKTAKPVVDGRDSPPIALMQESGIVWGLGSDGTVVSTINPFHTLWWVTSGKVFPNEVSIRTPVSREDALIAHTRSNAFLMFKENELGSLEVGKWADMVVLDRDYLTVAVDEIREIEPIQTIVAGKVVFKSENN